MPKYVVLAVVIALALMSLLTYKFAKESYRILLVPESPPSAADLEVYNFQNWHEFSAPDGDFDVLLPTPPQNATDTVNDPKTGMTRKYKMYVAEKNDGTIFMITLITFTDMASDIDPEKLMKEMMTDMMSANPENELRTMTETTYKGNKALDFAFGHSESTVDARTFVVDNTLYILSRMVKTKNYNANEYNFFINSFDLTSSLDNEERRSK